MLSGFPAVAQTPDRDVAAVRLYNRIDEIGRYYNEEMSKSQQSLKQAADQIRDIHALYIKNHGTISSDQGQVFFDLGFGLLRASSSGPAMYSNSSRELVEFTLSTLVNAGRHFLNNRDFELRSEAAQAKLKEIQGAQQRLIDLNQSRTQAIEESERLGLFRDISRLRAAQTEPVSPVATPTSSTAGVWATDRAQCAAATAATEPASGEWFVVAGRELRLPGTVCRSANDLPPSGFQNAQFTCNGRASGSVQISLSAPATGAFIQIGSRPRQSIAQCSPEIPTWARSTPTPVSTPVDNSSFGAWSLQAGAPPRATLQLANHPEFSELSLECSGQNSLRMRPVRRANAASSNRVVFNSAGDLEILNVDAQGYFDQRQLQAFVNAVAQYERAFSTASFYINEDPGSGKDHNLKGLTNIRAALRAECAKAPRNDAEDRPVSAWSENISNVPFVQIVNRFLQIEASKRCTSPLNQPILVQSFGAQRLRSVECRFALPGERDPHYGIFLQADAVPTIMSARTDIDPQLRLRSVTLTVPQRFYSRRSEEDVQRHLAGILAEIGLADRANFIASGLRQGQNIYSRFPGVENVFWIVSFAPDTQGIMNSGQQRMILRILYRCGQASLEGPCRTGQLN